MNMNTYFAGFPLQMFFASSGPAAALKAVKQTITNAITQTFANDLFKFFIRLFPPRQFCPFCPCAPFARRQPPCVPRGIVPPSRSIINEGGRSIVQSDFFCNQGLASYAIEKLQKERRDEKRRERAANRSVELRKPARKTPQNVAGVFYPGADGTGLAGVVVITGVQENEEARLQKRRENT
jgi:hypothetical protein